MRVQACEECTAAAVTRPPLAKAAAAAVWGPSGEAPRSLLVKHVTGVSTVLRRWHHLAASLQNPGLAMSA